MLNKDMLDVEETLFFRENWSHYQLSTTTHVEAQMFHAHKQGSENLLGDVMAELGFEG